MLDFHARTAVCLSTAEKAARFRHACDFDAGARHWREHCDLQRRQCASSSPTALIRIRNGWSCCANDRKPLKVDPSVIQTILIGARLNAVSPTSPYSVAAEPIFPV